MKTAEGILNSDIIEIVELNAHKLPPEESGPMKGFVLDEGMVGFRDINRNLVAASYLTVRDVGCGDYYVVFISDGYSIFKDWVLVSDIKSQYIHDMAERAKELQDSKDFEEVVKEALKHPMEERGFSHYKIRLTDTVPGDKCNDGGEYGFYTHIKPTGIIGVFRVWTTCTCDFDDCGTDGCEENGKYRYFSQAQLDEMIQESERIEEEGSKY